MGLSGTLVIEGIFLSGALKGMFPRLYSLSTVKAAKVAEIGNWSNGVWI